MDGEEATFRELWGKIRSTWERAPHCMRAGCGRETFAYWVTWATGRHAHKQKLRRVLMEAVRRGMLVKTQSPIGGYSRFCPPGFVEDVYPMTAERARNGR